MKKNIFYAGVGFGTFLLVLAFIFKGPFLNLLYIAGAVFFVVTVVNMRFEWVSSAYEAISKRGIWRTGFWLQLIVIVVMLTLVVYFLELQ